MPMCCTEDKSNTRESREERLSQVIAGLVRDAEPRIFTKEKELKSAFEAAHTADFDSFVFKCQKWGHFLAIQIKRGEEYYASSINLNIVKEIKMIEGHAPDQKGILDFNCGPVRDEDIDADHKYYNFHSGYATDDHLTIKSGYLWKLFPNFPALPYQRKMFLIAEITSTNTSSCNGTIVQSNGIINANVYYSTHQNSWSYSRPVKHKVPNFPRPAEDDMLNFFGLNAVLFAPAGRGAEVLQCILQEIRKGKDNDKEA